MNKILLILLVLISMMMMFCGCTTTEENGENGDQEQQKEENNDKSQYSWSTMNEGPYNDQISYATSTDLLTWVDSEVMLAQHASVPGAIYKDGVIYVYFVDVSVDGIPERTGLITSSDEGMTWSEIEYVTFNGIGDMVPVDPCPFLLDDGRIRLYYYDINEGRQIMTLGMENKMYSAISSDGITFDHEDGVRFSDIDVYDPDVIQVDDTWRMYVGNIAENKVISATSTNGLDFTKEGTALSGGAVPDVFYKENVYYLYTAGIDISTSSDGATFTKTTNRFESNINMLTADPSVIELEDGSYIMFYKTKI